MKNLFYNIYVRTYRELKIKIVHIFKIIISTQVPTGKWGEGEQTT